MKSPAKSPEHQYIVNEHGRRVSVVLSVEDFAELIEDLSDLAAIAQGRVEPTADHSDLTARLKADGLL